MGETRLDQSPDEKITQRALAPLPDLASIVFFRKANREFVTGRGPLATQAGRGARRFIRWGMWLFLSTGIATSLVVGAIEIYMNQTQQPDLDIGYIIAGPLLLFLAGVYWFIGWVQSRRASKKARLAAEGGLLPGELIKAKYYSGSGDNNVPTLRIDYRFTAPDGQTVEKRQILGRFDFTRNTLPPPGTQILVLYVDKELFEAL